MIPNRAKHHMQLPWDDKTKSFLITKHHLIYFLVNQRLIFSKMSKPSVPTNKVLCLSLNHWDNRYQPECFTYFEVCQAFALRTYGSELILFMRLDGREDIHSIKSSYPLPRRIIKDVKRTQISRKLFWTQFIALVNIQVLKRSVYKL